MSKQQRIWFAAGGGSMVDVGSIVSAVGMKETAAYAASKGAIAQLTRIVALEYGEQGIRANAIGVGVVETHILAGIVEDSHCRSTEPPRRYGQACWPWPLRRRSWEIGHPVDPGML